MGFERYRGLTHFVRTDFGLKIWKRFMCSRNMHAFDEVYSPAHGEGRSHYLSCDACNLMVYISKIDDQYVEGKLK